MLKQSILEGFSAARRNRAAGIALWSFGCLIIIGYYFNPAINHVFESIAAVKIKWGFVFSAISTGVFGGLIPSLLQTFSKKNQPDPGSAYLFSNTLFWAFKGVEVDLFYRMQAMIFGNGSSLQTVVSKMAIDQFVYVPAIGLVNVILFFVWRECNYDFKAFRKRLGQSWYRKRILPVLIANWVIWIPAVILIYCFPTALQLPVQNLILCFWILLLTLLTTRSEQGHKV